MTPDPFRVRGPAVLSVSGGRTSAYMLRRVLDAHGGALPPDVVACFANTGREMPGTLDFVRDLGERWNVPLVWLEERPVPAAVRVANATARSTGAIGEDAVVPAFVRKLAKPGETILDFGAGPAAAHAKRLRALGLDVRAHEFGKNFRPGVHDPAALSRRYSIAYASNVLNTLDDGGLLDATLDTIAACVAPEGCAVVNLPRDPRKGAWTGTPADEGSLSKALAKRFDRVASRLSGSTRVWVASAPKPGLVPRCDPGQGFAVVDHASASRGGEPFAALIARKRYLPNPVQRFCTEHLKVRPIAAYARSLGWPLWRDVLGIRADEPARAYKLLDPARRIAAGRSARPVSLPLHAAGVTKADVLAFWSAQDFDLRLRGAWEGNCDGCFLKRRAAVARLHRDEPERMAWWPMMESACAGTGSVDLRSSSARFRADRESYAELFRVEMAQGRLELDIDDDGGDVFAACNSGCGA